MSSNVETLTSELLQRTKSYRLKLIYFYHNRNYHGITRSGYQNTWCINLDDLDSHLVYLAWRIARWSQKNPKITDTNYQLRGALKYYLREIKSLFCAKNLPVSMLYPIAVRNYTHQPDADSDPSNSPFAPISKANLSDPEEVQRVQKAVQWAKTKTQKQMRLKRKSLEYQYLEFVSGLALAGLPMHYPIKNNAVLPHNRVSYLKRQFVKHLRQWYVLNCPELIS